MKGKLCVIGWPVEHSLSPLLHNTMLEELGLEYEYGCQPVRPDGLEEFLDFALRAGYVGFNATMPFKTMLARRVDVLDPAAARLEAVNTVCIKEGKLYGYNTDEPGYIAALREAGFDPKGKKAVVLGAGGAARAVALGLRGAGVRSLVVCNRTEEKARALAGLAPSVISARSMERGVLTEALEDADLLVNGTSVGMAGQGEWEDLSFLEALPREALVSDLIYHPRETALLARAGELGHPVMNGLPLLLHQAILALERFTGQDIPAERVMGPLRRAMETR